MLHLLLSLRKSALALLVFLLSCPLVSAQETPDGFLDSFLGHFNYAGRVLRLAEVMPSETYDWSPGPDVMSVERVYMHIARYNYLYPATSLGIDPPDDIDLDTMEEITGKEAVVEHLRRSIEHVQEVAATMSPVELAEQTTLYGRDVQSWEVLLQLLTHMSEHVGQSIAYARMNDVVPPW